MTENQPTLDEPRDELYQLSSYCDGINDASNLLIQQSMVKKFGNGMATSPLTEAPEQLNTAPAALSISRSSTLSNERKLTEAIADALDAIKCQPESVEGYLAAGKLYATQGNPKKAIKAYEQDLCIVLPSDWPLFYEQRSMATNRMNQRIDMSQNFPPRLLSPSLFTPLLTKNSDTLGSIVLKMTEALTRTDQLIQSQFIKLPHLDLQIDGEHLQLAASMI
ncbi:hypothetical protein BJV82DRAFT_674659 [Fennellomyces sp. T-0311]|nr:hypothetical protein BJV82DRAFT_674659 [Fennellomyces sp. T-0311]